MTTGPDAAPIPGDPAGVADDARALADRARRLADVAAALHRIDTGAWTGPAADAWRERHTGDVARWLQAADSLDAAAQALAEHARTLSWAQGQAARAADLDADTARDTVERARDQLRRSGDRVAAALRGEAALAPQDSQKNIDAEFYGGIWQSVSSAATGVWHAVTDPADTVAGLVQSAADPVGTARDAVAWDDWTTGHEPRALGRNAGDLFLGALTLGGGKIASALGRDRPPPHDATTPGADDPPPRPADRAPADSPESRAETVRNVVSDGGRPYGSEDSKGVYLIDETRLADMRRELHERLGEPSQVTETGKGRVETWMLDDDSKANITYRTYSKSGGPTIDVNRMPSVPVARYHITKEGS